MARHRIQGVVTRAVTVLVTAACGGTAPGSSPETASEAEWRALARPRPQPLEGAPRITVSAVDFVGSYPWPASAPVGPVLGVSELVATGLLRRRDVDFVERRRFSVAAEAERGGERRRPGQPPAGVSRSVDFSMNALWLPSASGSATVEIRLVRLESGDVAGATRVTVPADASPVALARSIVDGALGVLDDLGRRPEWRDPRDPSANIDRSPGVATDALLAFLRGLAAEEAWNWEGARRGYLAAARDPGFHEASTALARAARLRMGGTLAESQDPRAGQEGSSHE